MRKRYYKAQELAKEINELYNENGDRQMINALAKAYQLIQYIDYLKAANWDLNFDCIVIHSDYSAKGILKFSYEVSFKIKMAKYSFKMKSSEGQKKVHEEVMKKIERSNHVAYRNKVEAEEGKMRNCIRRERLAKEAI